MSPRCSLESQQPQASPLPAQEHSRSLAWFVVSLVETVAALLSTRESYWKWAKTNLHFRGILRDTKWLVSGRLSGGLFNFGNYLVAGLMLSKSTVGLDFFAFNIIAQAGVLSAANLQMALPSSQRSVRNRTTHNTIYRARPNLITAPHGLIAVVVDPITRIIWLDKWAAAIPAMQALALLYPPRMTTGVTPSAFRAKGAFKSEALLTLAEGLAVTAAAAAASYYFGTVLSLTIAVGAVVPITRYVVCAIAVGPSPGRWKKLAITLLPPWFLCSAIAIAVIVIHNNYPAEPDRLSQAVRLIILGASYTLITTIAIRLTEKSRLAELLSLSPTNSERPPKPRSSSPEARPRITTKTIHHPPKKPNPHHNPNTPNPHPRNICRNPHQHQAANTPPRQTHHNMPITKPKAEPGPNGITADRNPAYTPQIPRKNQTTNNNATSNTAHHKTRTTKGIRQGVHEMITPNKQRKTIRVFHRLTTPLLAFAATLLAPAVLSPILNTQAQALAQPSRNADFPPFEDVAKDFTRVVSTTDESSFYTLWRRDKDQQLLAELPRGFERQRHFFAMTVSSGELFAGLQGNDLYVYWKRYDNRLALIAPELNTRSTGDAESRTSVERIFTDRVLLDVPILTMGPAGGPVIDFNNLPLGSAGTFFGSSARGLNPRLATITRAKAFPENIVVAFEAPTAGGILKSFTYSISLLKGSPSYKPREADPRVGYFTTSYRDLGKFSDDEKWVRYINRWHIEKQDPSRRLSPPKEPIVFYVEHTVPIRYRRFVRQGIDYWNKAFENIGIVDAIEVRYQDAESGAHMEKDPEDVRYNFIRWLSNDIGTAIGPSRVNPNTGQILDADVILTDGWIRYFWFQYNTLMPELLMDGFTPETLAWLEQNPRWDPRLRMANPAQREQILAQRAAERARGITRFGGHAVSQASSTTFGQNEFDGLAYRTSQFNGLCMAATGKAIGMTMMRMHSTWQQHLIQQQRRRRPRRRRTQRPTR